jgi:hypothetical protein
MPDDSGQSALESDDLSSECVPDLALEGNLTTLAIIHYFSTGLTYSRGVHGSGKLLYLYFEHG